MLLFRICVRLRLCIIISAKRFSSSADMYNTLISHLAFMVDFKNCAQNGLEIIYELWFEFLLEN